MVETGEERPENQTTVGRELPLHLGEEHGHLEVTTLKLL